MNGARAVPHTWSPMGGWGQLQRPGMAQWQSDVGRQLHRLWESGALPLGMRRERQQAQAGAAARRPLAVRLLIGHLADEFSGLLQAKCTVAL